MQSAIESRFRHTSRAVLTSLMLASLFFCAACSKKGSNADPSSAANAANARRNSNSPFFANLPPGMAIPDQTDEVSMRLLADYGAMFVARGGAVPPTTIIFADETEVSNWQAKVKRTRAELGGITVELQAPAMTALMDARSEAQKAKLDLTPRGTDAARRSYTETVTLWQSRVNPGLTHWVNEGKLTEQEAERIRSLSPREQIPEILRLEKQGLYFSKDFSKSILYSVAAPGTSQHLSMLAFDAKEYENATVRAILARHGWFQTVTSDTPHFTFLGVSEDQLPALGLKKVTNGGRAFWIPNID